MSEILCECCNSEGDHPSRIICDACFQCATGKAACCIVTQAENKRLKELCKKALKVLEIRSQSKNLYYPSITIDEVSVLQALSESQKGDE